MQIANIPHIPASGTDTEVEENIHSYTDISNDLQVKIRDKLPNNKGRTKVLQQRKLLGIILLAVTYNFVRLCPLPNLPEHVLFKILESTEEETIVYAKFLIISTKDNNNIDEIIRILSSEFLEGWVPLVSSWNCIECNYGKIENINFLR